MTRNIQLADMLIKDNFTRDEWVIFSVWSTSWISRFFSCSHFPSNRKQSIMSKRARERGVEEGPAIAKRKSTCLVSKGLNANQSPTLDSDTSCSPGNCRLGWNSDLSKRWEIGARQRRKLIVEFSCVTQRGQSVSKYRQIGAGDKTACMYWDTSAWSTESNYSEKVEPSQSSVLR